MRIGVLGINHKLADLKLRELLARVCQRRFGAGSSMHNQHECVLLSTCNRTEVYFNSTELTFTHSYLLNILRQDLDEDFDQKLYSYFGHDCFLHLCRVTAGLDSAVIGETEIQGQVKAAYEQVAKHCLLPYELHYLFQKSLNVGKKVRQSLPSKPGLPDIEHAILESGQQLFPSPKHANVLFIGASEINLKILGFFKRQGISSITLCNRTEEKGKFAADQHGIRFLAWKHLEEWPNYDWIILGTKAPHYFIHSEKAPRTPIHQKLIIDLSVPRNADPLLGKSPGITLLNIDQINRRLKMRRKSAAFSISQAEELLLAAATRQMNLFQEKEKHRLQPLYACMGS